MSTDRITPSSEEHHRHRLHDTRVAKRARLFRARLNHYPRLRLLYKVLVGIVGGAVVVFGIIDIPLPGPGWLIVFLGLAILGTEFPAAHRVNLWAQRTLKRFWNWFRAKRGARVQARTESRRASALR